MESSLDRRGFFSVFSTLLGEKKVAIPPPYMGEGATLEGCRTCEGMCVSACKEKIIRLDSAHIPYLDFGMSGCSDCQQCLEACTPDILSDPGRFIQGKARLDTRSCMGYHDTICFSCKELCPTNAIVFEGMFRPHIDVEQCSGCGYCVGVCPSGAIRISA